MRNHIPAPQKLEHRIGASLSQVARFSANHAKWVVLLTLLVCGSAIWYTSGHLSMDTDPANMISAQLPFRQDYDRLKRHFGQDTQALVVVIEADTPEAASEASHLLQQRIHAHPEIFSGFYAPGDSAFFEHQGLLYLSPQALQDVADRLALAQPMLARLGADPSLYALLELLDQLVEAQRDHSDDTEDFSLLLSPIARSITEATNGRTRAMSWQSLMASNQDQALSRRFVLARPNLDFSQLLPAAIAIRTIHRWAGEIARATDSQLEIRITGSPALSFEEMQTVKRGALIAGPLSMLLVLISLGIGLRSSRLVAATLTTLVLGLMLTLGFAALSVGHLNMISVAFAVLYIGLGVDYAIHLCLAFRNIRRQGQGAVDAIAAAVADVGPSLLLCAVSTMIGFYAFVPTAYAGVSELGLISGTGMLISLLLSITLLPALLSWVKIENAPTRPASQSAGHWLGMPFRHSRLIRIVTWLSAMAALGILPWVQFNDNPLDLRDPKAESVVLARELLANDKQSPWTLSVLTDSATEAESIRARLAALPEVARALSLESFIPTQQAAKLAILDDTALLLGLDVAPVDLQQATSIDKADAILHDLTAHLNQYQDTLVSQTLPTGLDELHTALNGLKKRLKGLSVDAQQLLLLRIQHNLLRNFPAAMARLQDSLSARNVDYASLPAQLKARWHDPAGVYRVEAQPVEDLNDHAALTRFVDAVRAVAPHASGSPVFNLESGRAVVRAFQQSFIGALLLITLVVVLVFRNLKDTLYVLSPLLLTGLLTGAIAALTGLAFNFANVIALPLLLGLGVDNGIHMVHRMRNLKDNPDRLLHTATARAILFSAITTVVSFISLTATPHRGTASLGWLLALGVAITLIATLVILPAFLHRRWQAAND